MELCNNDMTLIMWLVELIHMLLDGFDPWNALKMMYDLALTCGRTTWT